MNLFDTSYSLRPLFRIVIVCVCIFFSVPVYAQTDTVYYDRYQEKTTKKIGIFYRIYKKDGDVYRFKSYYLNDSLHMTGALSSLDPEIKHGFFKQYDQSGNVVFKGSYKKNKLEGSVAVYVPGTGKQFMQFTFDNDIPNGEAIMYDTANGSIVGRGNMLGDYKDGQWTFFYNNSKDTFARYNYANGEREGAFVWLHRSGNKMGEGRFERGNIVGSIVFYYDRPGVVALTVPFYIGLANGIAHRYDSATGKVIEEGEYMDGKRIGKWYSFYGDGRKMGVENYRDGVLHGDVEMLYPSGIKKELATYKFGVPGGKQFTYYADGSIRTVEDFIAGSGYQTFIYYDSASKKVIRQGEGRNRKRTGLWYSFAPGTDIVIGKERYENGELNGDHNEYYSDGSKRIEGRYKNGVRVKEWNWYYKETGAIWIKAYYNADGMLTGELLAYHENGELKRREVRDGSTLAEYKCYSASGHDTTYTPLEVKAAFDGEVSTFIGKELRYPQVSRLQGIEGKVKVEFVVNEDGSISDATILESLSSECDEEALRIIHAMPKWHPANIDGQPYRSTVSVPIVFWIPEKVNG